MPNKIKVQNFYSATITSDIPTTGDTSFTVSTPPSNTNGFICISPDNISQREIVYYHNVSGSTISVRAENRGLGGTTAKTHTSTESISIKDVAEIFNTFSDMISQTFYVEKIGGLNVNVWGGYVFYNGNVVSVADTDLVLTNNTTNYIKYDYPTNVISVSTINSGNIKAEVVVLSGVITAVRYRHAKESFIDFTVTLNGALPPQVGNSGKALLTEGTNPTWGVCNLPRTIGTNKHIVVDRPTGIEVIKDVTDDTTFSSTDKFRLQKSDGNYKDVPYSSLSILLGKYIKTAYLGEDLSATTYFPIVKVMSSNTTPSPFVASASQTISASYEAWRAFDRIHPTDTWLELTSTDNTTDRWIKIDMGVAYPIGKIGLQFNDFTTNNGWASGWKIEGSNNDSTWTTLFTGGSSPTGTRSEHTFTAGTFRYIRFIGKKNNTSNGTPGLSTFDIYAESTNPKAIAIVNAPIIYQNTLGSNIAGSRLLTGIRFSVPYATTLGVVKTSQVATSSSARIQLRDDSGTLIAEQTPSISSDTVTFPNTPISPNTVYRIVENDNANFGNNSNELGLVSYQAGMQFCISGTLNGDNTVVPQQIKEIQMGAYKAVQATAGSTAEYATLAGFIQGSAQKGSVVSLDANDGAYITGFSYLESSNKYYVSDIPGIVDIYAGTISRIVGMAMDSTGLLLNSLYYPGTTITKP